MDTRPRTPLTLALAMLLLLGVGHLLVPFVPDAGKIPLVVVYGDVVLGALSFIAAFGLPKRARWGRVLTLTIAVLNVVSAAPGVVAAPHPALRVVTAAYVVLSLVVCGLVALPAADRSSARHAPSVPR